MSKIDEHYREREELGLGDGYSDGTEGYVFKEHSDKMKKKKKIIIEIDVHKMVTWFWGSRDEREQLACQVIEDIQEGGRCEITYQTAWDSLGYIPAHILTDKCLKKYGIDDSDDLESWEHSDDIDDYIHLDSDGKKVKW